MQKLFPIIMTCLAFALGLGPVSAKEHLEPVQYAANTKKESGKAPKDAAATPADSKKKGKGAAAAKQRRSPKRRVGKKNKKTKEATNTNSAEAFSSDEVAKAIDNLASADPDVVIEAIQVLGMSGDTTAIPPLLALLETGPRSDITDAALFALGMVPHPDAVPMLTKYLNHRRAGARVAAIMALENNKGAAVTKALEAALADSDRQVRATAAMALGKTGNSDSVPLLFTAFERGVTEAAIAIGQIGSVEDSKKLTRYLGKERIKVLLAGFDEFLKRPDFPEDAKLNILNRLFDLAGPEVWRFAVTLKATFPPETDENEDRVYNLVCRMVRQIKDK